MDVDETLNQLGALATDAKEGLVAALPNVLAALAVLVLGWSLAWLLRAAVARALRRLGGRPGRGGAEAEALEPTDDHNAGQLAANGAYWLVLLGTFVVAVDALDVPLLRRWMAALGGFLPRAAIAVALVLGGVVFGRFAAAAIMRTTRHLPVSQARRLSRLAQVTIVGATALIAAAQLGLDVSLLTSVFLIALAAILGGAALAFALGAREVVTDILAMHYVNRSYQIGQIVRIGEDQGRIVRTTRTCVYLESKEGELAIPGRHFADSRRVLVSEEVRRA